MYVCEFCGREFPSAGGINGHRNAHLIRNEFGHRIGLPCEVCEETTYYQMQGIPYHPDCFAQRWSDDEEYEAEWKRPRKAKKKSGVKLLPSSLTTGLSEMTEMISGKTVKKNADTNRWHGACILPDGSCRQMDFATCNAFGGKFQSPQTTCDNTQRWVDADLAQDFMEDRWYQKYQAEDRPEEERMTRATADNLVAQILEWLEPFTDFAEVCGSYRRGREDPGDLDVVVILKSRVSLPEITELWVAEGKASAVNWVGDKKTQMVIEGVKVDIRTSTPRALGAALLYFTGPSGYNIGIRSAAKRAGFKLNEYGLFNRETGEYIAGATEEDIYAALGRNYRPPTERRAESETFEAQEYGNNCYDCGGFLKDCIGYVDGEPCNQAGIGTRLCSKCGDGPRCDSCRKIYDYYGGDNPICEVCYQMVPYNPISNVGESHKRWCKWDAGAGQTAGTCEICWSEPWMWSNDLGYIFFDEDSPYNNSDYERMCLHCMEEDFPEIYEHLVNQPVKVEPTSKKRWQFWKAETFAADYVSCDNCGDGYSDANNTDLGCQCEICPTCVIEYEGICPECSRMDAETFEASAVYRGKIPDGAVGRAMLNQKLMDEAEMLEAIQKLENAVRLGLISEEEIMRNLQQKFGAEVVMSRYSGAGWSLFGRKLYKYGQLQGSIRGNLSASTKKPMKRNNPDETYSGRHHVIWIHNPDNQVFNQVSQKIKPESFEEWMDVIHETNRQLNHIHEGPKQWHGKAENFATEGSENPMRSAIIRGLRTAARDGYVVAAPPYGNRSAGFYNNLAQIILEELGEIGTEDLGPEVSGTGRAMDPYRVVADLASGQSVEIESPDEVSDYSVGIADMITSFTQQSTIMDRNDGFIPPEGYTLMEFDLPYNGMITRRLAWKISSAMGIYSRASNRLLLYSSPQKNRNCSMIINMLLEELQPEVSSMTDEEKEQYYQEFTREIMRQVGYYGGPLEEEENANREWANNNYGTAVPIEQVEVSASIGEKARADATRLNPFRAETQDFADRFEIQIRTSRGNTTERIPVGRPMLVRRLREILSRQRLPYAIDVFGTEAAFNVMGPFGMQVYRPRPKLLATYKYGRFESGEMADHLNEKLGL
jgi:hypothetical protein